MPLALARPNLQKPFGASVISAWIVPVLSIGLTLILGASPTNNPAKGPTGKPEPEIETATLKRDAVAVANALATQYPSDPLVYALLGSAHFNIGQADEALRHLRHCIELNPNQADVYEIQARIAYDKGQIDESVRLFQEALKRGSPNADLLNRLGRVRGLVIPGLQLVADDRPTGFLGNRRLEAVFLEEAFFVGNDDGGAIGQRDNAKTHVRGFW